MRISLISLAAAGAFALSGCAYGGYGYGLGYGGYYGDPGWGAPYYGYDYGYYDPFGWYGDYYYPGAGVYVYDQYRRPRVWTNSEQRYWSGRRDQYQSRSGRTVSTQNWSGFNHRRSRQEP